MDVSEPQVSQLLPLPSPGRGDTRERKMIYKTGTLLVYILACFLLLLCLPFILVVAAILYVLDNVSKKAS